jgi:hypothetical protein
MPHARAEGLSVRATAAATTRVIDRTQLRAMPLHVIACSRSSNYMQLQHAAELAMTSWPSMVASRPIRSDRRSCRPERAHICGIIIRSTAVRIRLTRTAAI